MSSRHAALLEVTTSPNTYMSVLEWVMHRATLYNVLIPSACLRGLVTRSLQNIPFADGQQYKTLKEDPTVTVDQNIMDAYAKYLAKLAKYT